MLRGGWSGEMGLLSSWEVMVNVGLGKLSPYPFSSGWLNNSNDI